MRRLIGFGILAFFIFSCSQHDKKTDPLTFFNIDNFKRDTLYINSQFMECGEFGGHLELSKVYLNGKDFYINYQKFDADCNSINHNKGKPVQKLIKNITKKVSNNGKVMIYHYIHQLLDAKFREPIAFPAGHIFQVINCDKSIYINVYPGSLEIANHYSELIENLIK